jgi:preprotein translocase subunit SecG
MSTFSIFLVLIVIVAFLLVLVVMVQNPKGGGLSSSFGGGGSQQIGGVKQTSDFLDKSTWALATTLLVLVLIANSVKLSETQSQESKILGTGNDTEMPANDIPVAPESGDNNDGEE